MKFKLSGDAMYLFSVPGFDLELMNMPNDSNEKTFTFAKTGLYPFSCGKHGDAKQTLGVVKVN